MIIDDSVSCGTLTISHIRKLTAVSLCPMYLQLTKPNTTLHTFQTNVANLRSQHTAVHKINKVCLLSLEPFTFTILNVFDVFDLCTYGLVFE